VVSGSDDRTLRVWDLARGLAVQVLEGHTLPVNALAVLPDDRVVSGSDDRTLRVWDHQFQSQLCFVADGAVACLTGRAHPLTIIVGSADGAVHFLSFPDAYSCPVPTASTHETTHPQPRPWIDWLHGRK
jgi:WD40 repeat protein